MNFILYAAACLGFLPTAINALLLLQQNGYAAIRQKRFWIINIILSGIVAIATIISFFVSEETFIYLFIATEAVSLTVNFVLYFRSRGRIKRTRRMLRLMLFGWGLYGALMLLPALLVPRLAGVGFLLPVPAALVAARVLLPVETKNNLRYHKMLKDRLNAAPHLIRIGITGSAGKTSVKNFLYQMLSTKFRVLMSGKNFNTPLGLWLTVKDEDLKNYDIFIAEMGARKKGDIKELAELVSPDAGIVTAVLPQHIETFGSIETVRNEKAELARAVRHGPIVLNFDDERVRRMSDETLGEVLAVGEGCTFEMKDVKADYSGTEFTLTSPLGNIPLKTDVLGKHTAKNIALAAALALRLGIPPEDVQFAVLSLKPVPHRLQMLKNPSGIAVLDDGYNANVTGAENGLEVVGTYPGRRVVFSQGIVELGAAERDLNVALGKKIAEVADILVITGRLGDYIYEGAKGSDLQIIRVKDIKEAKKLFGTLLNAGDLLYLQNDLPEIYR